MERVRVTSKGTLRRGTTGKSDAALSSTTPSYPTGRLSGRHVEAWPRSSVANRRSKPLSQPSS
eukprot:4157869-Pyramimonas_sp.AAC.1